MKTTRTSIALPDALRLLRDGRRHRLRLWKISTGDILTYPAAVSTGHHTRGALQRVRLLPSGEIRAFRVRALFEIDGMRIYW